MTRRKLLTPKAKTFYGKLQQLQQKLGTMRTSKRRINFVKNNIDKSQLLTDINATTTSFFISQMLTQKFKPIDGDNNIQTKFLKYINSVRKYFVYLQGTF